MSRVDPCMLRDPVVFAGLGFGSGLSPKAPGTAGTLMAVPIAALVSWIAGPLGIWLLVAVSVAFGSWICGHTARKLGVHDHPAIVWDEFAGFWLTMAFVPMGALNLLLGFALFRLFDIAKPWPISWFDRHVHGGHGIMIDDLLAGLMAGGLLWLGQGWL